MAFIIYDSGKGDLFFRNAGQRAIHVPHDGDNLRGDGSGICPHALHSHRDGETKGCRKVGDGNQNQLQTAGDFKNAMVLSGSV